MPPRKKAVAPATAAEAPLPDPPVAPVVGRGRRGGANAAVKDQTEISQPKVVAEPEPTKRGRRGTIASEFLSTTEAELSPSKEEAPVVKRGRKPVASEPTPIVEVTLDVVDQNPPEASLHPAKRGRKNSSIPEQLVNEPEEEKAAKDEGSNAKKPILTHAMYRIDDVSTAKVSPSPTAKDIPKPTAPRTSKTTVTPTVQDLSQDRLTEIAASTWVYGSSQSYDSRLVEQIFYSQLSIGSVSKVLDYSGYLEKYLWVHYSHTVSLEHVLSVMIMMNENIKESANSFDSLTSSEEKFIVFFNQVVSLAFSDLLGSSNQYMTVYIEFLTHMFRSLDNSIVRQNILQFVSLPIWEALPISVIDGFLEAHPQLERHWKQLAHQKRSKKGENHEAKWIPKLIEDFLATLENELVFENFGVDQISYVERFVDFLSELLSQLSSRRFLNTLVHNLHVVVRCRRSVLALSSHGKLFNRMVDILDTYVHFEIDDFTSQSLSSMDVLARQNAKLHKLQTVAYNNHRESLKELIFSSTGSLGDPRNLLKHLEFLSVDELFQLAVEVGIASDHDLQRLGSPTEENVELQEYLLDVFVDQYKHRKVHHESVKSLPMFPDEKFLWGSDSIPHGSTYNGSSVISLPKLNLQYLTMHDCLYRNFNLVRLEGAFEIREDIVDAVKRMGPRQSLSGSVSFAGFSRMAVSVQSVNVTEVTKPPLGSIYPSHVHCFVEIDLSTFTGAIRTEWDSLKDHDCIYLVCIENPSSHAAGNLEIFERERRLLSQGMKPRSHRDFQWDEETSEFATRYGVKYLRGGEIIASEYTEGVDSEQRSQKSNPKRLLKLMLDPVQYYNDMKDGLQCYEKVNLLVRRNPKENNNKAVLSCIKDLMSTSPESGVLPTWFEDIFLGYGKPDSSHYRNIDSSSTEDMIYDDTFQNLDHVLESFPLNEIEVASHTEVEGPFRLQVSRGDTAEKDKIIVSSCIAEPMSPFAPHIYVSNNVRFTPRQIEAIRSGMNKGLTVVVGPPGTGKTDVAVQIANNLYRNFRDEKILVLAHSNAALDDIFFKIKMRKIDPGHMVRLGTRDKIHETEDFSRKGRVNWTLFRRQKLLEVVQQFAISLGVAGDVGYSCETAMYFYTETVKQIIDKYLHDTEASGVSPKDNFPFIAYFGDIFPQDSNDSSTYFSIARRYFDYIERVFSELATFKVYELLRNQKQREDHILTSQARIVAMTFTHAALIRKKLIELGFTYHSVIIEEAAQVLEIETVIPLLMQAGDQKESSRLKRVILLGDHHQLPPVVKNLALKKYSRFDQSLYSRLVRLGVHTIKLDMQGRARPELSALYSWRYNTAESSLLNLPVVLKDNRFLKANVGFRRTFQFINVENFQGRGEHSPSPYSFQNSGEAEYVVAVFMYMRLLGYPAEKITILTSYNGQKNLIRDILEQRCQLPMFGKPAKVTTVDKYQGNQNDFILLSLVRTESVGHMRDIRRLVVAMSRAKLGLYVFGRQRLFENCLDLAPVFQKFADYGDKLELVPSESSWPYTKRLSTDSLKADQVHIVEDVTAMGLLVFQLAQQIQSPAL